MKVLITGVTGFLGWRAATLLAARGHDVLGLARPGAAARVHRERELGVDLREVREVALLAVRRVSADLAAQAAAVDVQRAAVHERPRR